MRCGQQTWRESSRLWPKGHGKCKLNTFLQFGPDNVGARDDYVYVYGRNETGWAEGIHGYLSRVHRAKIKTKEAYRFFAGLDRFNLVKGTLSLRQSRLEEGGQ